MKNKRGAQNQVLTILVTLILVLILIAIWYYSVKGGFGIALK